MDSLFTKVIFLFSFLLASITSPGYIKIAQDNLIFNFKTGEIFPIYYYLNTQNIGPQKARFEISSNVPWVSAYREGTDSTFVELPSQAYINFVLGIRPERLPDGINQAKVFIKVLDIDSLVSQELVLDKIEVSITLNKNIIPTKTPQPVLSPAMTPVSTEIYSPTPAASLIPTLSPGPSPDLSSILKQLQSLIDSLRLLLEKLF